MNDDLISRSELKKAILNILDLDNSSYWLVKKAIDNAPTVDITFKEVVAYECGQKSIERPKGEWIFGSTLGHGWMKCSNCCVSQSGQTSCWSYCPNCGADMRREE